jgi:hypothetical protein
MTTLPYNITDMKRGSISNISSHLEVLTLFTPGDMCDFGLISSIEFYKDILNYLTPNNFYKHDSQKIVHCFIQYIFSIIRESSDTGMLETASSKYNDSMVDPLYQFVTTFFSPIKTINLDKSNPLDLRWKSVEGIAASVGLRQPLFGTLIEITDKFAIMKLQQTKVMKDENLLHEIVIGLILNNMRSYLPCFMYTYGGMYCSYPSEQDMKADDYSDLCSSQENIHTLFLSEYIPDIGTMDKFIKDPKYTEEEKLKALLMIFFSLAEANRLYKFIHGDLHGNNILIRKLNEPVTFEFKYTDLTSQRTYDLAITTRYLPMIIDYGLSYVEAEGYILKPLKSTINYYQDPYCEGEREYNGVNCGIENMLVKGMYIPGLDAIRLMTTIDFDDFMNNSTSRGNLVNELKTIRDECFYNMAYQATSKGRMAATILNFTMLNRNTLNFGASKTPFLTRVIESPELSVLFD